MTYFDIRIPGLKMTVVAADGQYVNPVTVDEFRIAVAETYDVIVEPQGEAYTIFAQSMDRTGYARGTLATREGLSAAVPPLDPRPLLTMEDMGMGGMGGMGHDMAGMDHSQMGGMDNSGEMMSMDGADLPDSGTSSAPMDHSSMAGMDHSRMAGMPASVVARAEEILKNLELVYGNNEIVPSKSPRRRDRKALPGVREAAEAGDQTRGMQLSMFQLDDPVLVQIRDQIKGLDINALTPIEALNKLNEIKKITGL